MGYLKKIDTVVVVIMLVVIVGAIVRVGLSDSVNIKINTMNKNETWSAVENKTWFTNNGFSEFSYVFYTDQGGNKKGIRQLHGSGVLVVERAYVEIDLREGEVWIDDELYRFENNTLSSKGAVLVIRSEEPMIYNRLCGPLDFEFVASDAFDIDALDEPCL